MLLAVIATTSESMSSTPNGCANPRPCSPTKIHLETKSSTEVSAGLRSIEHYRQKLPPWRYHTRQVILPLVRLETPYLAWIQRSMRTPALDTYFATTANLGTHTFFMIVLPILFWCGYTSLGRRMVHILATGVFCTGFLKDMLSLPRPLTPPLHRITTSGSAALEYGFPSTHSANAASVAVHVLLMLNSPSCQFHEPLRLILKAAAYSYAFSIILGRLYCGMHGFLDVIVGSMIGVVISYTEYAYSSRAEKILYQSSWLAPIAVTLFIIFLIRIHPEPADDCPCYDDTVAFAGVLIGVEVGGWHYARGGWAWDNPVPATVPFDLQQMGWTVAVLRVFVGVFVIFAWREITKPAMLKFLPHIFRIIETHGLIIPRKFFKPASEYNIIPSKLKVDNVMPTAHDFSGFFAFVRHPSRGRSVVIGPQSAADAYEALARLEIYSQACNCHENCTKHQTHLSYSKTNSVSSSISPHGEGEDMMMRFSGAESSPKPPKYFWRSSPRPQEGLEDLAGNQTGVGRQEIMESIPQPRVRYDVEVVTKLVVYAGIAWLAVEGNPIIFEMIGLGLGSAPSRVS
ncbi:Bgt-986 [Blumeria graminis f. sp. tritici]|uniref:Bgt-986 n=2 Tax=Blumeria graminis f. sp. tritici TaxID=62690 RepID=A0A061HJG9_BLUGR|nr:Dihydrosphingosine 1-phosphate phosphatase [Blumeria graminis f. sp. tritici 96224]VDB88304.1 Bgt-986 [Blumeria graminis f. sp. tritici]